MNYHNDFDDYGEMPYMTKEAHYFFTLEEFMQLAVADPSGVAQDVVKRFKRSDISQFANMLDHFLHLPKVEMR